LRPAQSTGPIDPTLVNISGKTEELEVVVLVHDLLHQRVLGLRSC
jgi:hypothetical protein